MIEINEQTTTKVKYPIIQGKNWKGKVEMKLIDADKLFAAFEKASWYDNMDRDEVAEEILLRADIIEAVPVRHGKWVKYYRSGMAVSNGYVSSCCDMWNERKSNYCPHCGVKMDGE